jgi:CubicO group peptidase (beta-lactamase class C family)
MKALLIVLTILFYFYCLPASSQNISNIQLKIDSFEKELDFSGVVLIAKGDKILLHKGYGFTDKKKGIKKDENTAFQIASVTKAFTGLAIMKLAEQGKLSLQDFISKYFPNVPTSGTGITIHQLLIHQSGLPQKYKAVGNYNPEDAVKAIFKGKLEAMPGSKFIYSNDNYTLLALIIEKVVGKKWEDHIRETILKPLHMNQTYFWADQNNTGLSEAESKKRKQKRDRDYGFLGATGIFSTAADLQKFLIGINSGRILSDTSTSILLGKYIKLKSIFPNSTDHYAYGLFKTEGDTNSFWARGNEGDWGASIAYYFPKTDISVIVLSDKYSLSNGEKQHVYVSTAIINSLK